MHGFLRPNSSRKMRIGGIGPYFDLSSIPQRDRGAGGEEKSSDQEQCSLPCSKRGSLWGLSGGPVVKNLPPQPGWEGSWGRTGTCIYMYMRPFTTYLKLSQGLKS